MKRENRVCKACNSGEVEDVTHWLLRCPAWNSHQQPLLAFAQPSTEEEEQTAHLLAHACRNHKLLACIMSMWDTRFGSNYLGMPAHVVFYVSRLLTLNSIQFNIGYRLAMIYAGCVSSQNSSVQI